MKATLIGSTAIVMWSLLALLTAASGDVPPFQLNAMCFAIGTAIGLAVLAVRRPPPERLRLPPVVWLFGVGGLFGYHFFYFLALRHAPVIEASLIAYLWPLLIVVGSALLPGERLGGRHLAGALAGFAGTALIVGRDGVAFSGGFAFGYAAAFACAFVWSGYSLLSRRFADTPTQALSGFCAVSAGLSLACHLAFETTVWPSGATEWLAVAGLGLMPVGAAFYVWDYGVKHGNIQVLGTLSYGAPLLSTLILVAAGTGRADWRIGLACALIVSGGAIASRQR